MTAPIGHNQPPTPFDALKAHIDDLDMEARNHLDGKPIENETQAEAVAKLLDDARKAKTAADDQRKIEAKPFNDGKAAVQALWNPLLERAELVAVIAKNAQTDWLIKKEDEKRAAVEAATVEAKRLAAAARDASDRVNPSDLAGQTTVRVLRENAAVAAKAAERLDKKPVQAKGGARAVGLRSTWVPALTDAVAALRHYREHQPEELKAWLLEQAERDVRAGARSIPGFTVSEARGAV